jgi:hypothetical protein
MNEDLGSQDSRAAQLATTPQDTYPWASLPEYNGLPKPIPKEAIGHVLWVFEQRKQYWNNGAVPRMVKAAMPDLALRSCMDRYGLKRSQVMTQFHLWQKCGATVAATKGCRLSHHDSLIRLCLNFYWNNPSPLLGVLKTCALPKRWEHSRRGKLAALTHCPT